MRNGDEITQQRGSYRVGHTQSPKYAPLRQQAIQAVESVSPPPSTHTRNVSMKSFGERRKQKSAQRTLGMTCAEMPTSPRSVCGEKGGERRREEIREGGD